MDTAERSEIISSNFKALMDDMEADSQARFKAFEESMTARIGEFKLQIEADLKSQVAEIETELKQSVLTLRNELKRMEAKMTEGDESARKLAAGDISADTGQRINSLEKRIVNKIATANAEIQTVFETEINRLKQGS